MYSIYFFFGIQVPRNDYSLVFVRLFQFIIKGLLSAARINIFNKITTLGNIFK